MKKQNETKNEVKNEQLAAKPRRMKKARAFFLYVDGRGFISASDNGGMPVVGWKKPTSFSIRSKAMYAAEFFKQIGVADDIRVFMNIG